MSSEEERPQTWAAMKALVQEAKDAIPDSFSTESVTMTPIQLGYFLGRFMEECSKSKK